MQVKSNNTLGIIFFKCPNKVLALKGIHPKYYKHLKKVLTKAIWAEKKGWFQADQPEILNKIGI